ncbi:MAG: hypothetical protein ACON4Z_04260 [Planctomycetota bacterium]
MTADDRDPDLEPGPERAPREPEIELLGKLARAGLLLVRLAFLCAGAASLAYGLKKSLTVGDGWDWQQFAWRSTPSAAGALWVTLGLPLALPADFLLRRGRTQTGLLVATALLWFGPTVLPDDSDYGYVLRLFATLVAFLCLAVWRTLWRLTGTGLPRAGDDPTL